MGALAVLSISSGASAQTAKPTLSENTRVNPDNAEGRWHGQPFVAVDPANPKHVVIVERHQRPDGVTDCMVHTSYDAMATFTHGIMPIPHTCARYNTRGRVHAAIGGDSRAYFLGGDSGNSTVVPSTDGGLTFNEPANVAPGLNADFNRMAVRANPGGKDSVYVIRRGTSTATAGVRIATVSTSTDSGVSFGPPVQVSDLDKTLSGNENLHVEPGPQPGRVYAMYSDLRPAPVGAPTGFAYPGRLFLTRSDDDGASWTEPGAEIPTGIDKPAGNELNNYWSDLAVDQKSGNLYVVWSDVRNVDGDAFFIRSTDSGATWGSPVRLSHDTVGNGRHQNRTSLSVAPNGRIDVVYYDYVNTCPTATLPCFETDVYLRSSSDGGVSFGAADKLNPAPFDFRNKRGQWDNGDIQEVQTSVASVDELAYVAWMDTRLGTPDANNRDIAATRAQYSPFLRLLPPPEYLVVAVVETVNVPAPPRPAAPLVVNAPQPPAPPPLPPAAPPAPTPTPVPPAAPIVPTSPGAMLAAQTSSSAVGVGVLAPAPEAEVAPELQPRWQEATASDGGPVMFYASATLVGLVALALSLAAMTRLGPGARPVPARNRNS